MRSFNFISRLGVASLLVITSLSAGCDRNIKRLPEKVATNELAALLVPNIHQLSTTVWQLQQATNASNQRIDALFSPVDVGPVSLAFQDGRIRVNNTCNNMSAGYNLLENGQLKLDQLIATQMACEAPLMAREATMGRILEQGPLQLQLVEGGLKVTNTAGDSLVFGPNPNN